MLLATNGVIAPRRRAAANPGPAGFRAAAAPSDRFTSSQARGSFGVLAVPPGARSSGGAAP